MKELKEFMIGKESREDQFKAGRYHPGLEITFSDDQGLHRHKIAAGYSDEVHVFREGEVTMVLSSNLRLGYAGLEAFQGDARAGEVFLIGSEMLAAFGEEDLEPSRMLNILEEWL
ncbi:MAG: hypothetical protein AB2L22_13130 [Syntrophales bacterium]